MVRREVAGVRLAVASYNEQQADMARQLVAAGRCRPRSSSAARRS